MEYDFFGFNSSDFEHMIQSLARKLFGLSMITFGDGRDGGREAAFEGTYDAPLQKDKCWEGYWVIQAKFENKSDKGTDHFKWIKAQFKKEMKKFEKKKDVSKRPDNYLFFTNATLTGVEDSGGRDKIEALKKDYLHLIPNIMIYGYDDLKTFLDNNRDVATTYASFILTGDILKELLDMLKQVKINDFNKEKRHYNDIIKRFLHKEFKEDLQPKLEQSGKKTDQVIKLEQVFIDLYATSNGLVPKEKSKKKFVEQCIHFGNSILKSDRLSNKFVLLGNFGQGKSTLTQFLCQIYRAFFLKNLAKENSVKEVEAFIDKYYSYKDEEINCRRLPFKIELNDYAGWISKRKEDESCSVLSFLRNNIKGKSDIDDEIVLNDLRDIFKSLSLVFVFDGLDEVAITSNRKEVMKQINDFVDVELHHLESDAMIIITSRPQGYVYDFDREKYTHLFVADLPKDDCLKYLDLLLKSIEPEDKKRRRHKEILNRAIEDPNISELMKTPLQATIMAILVKSGGKPPKERYTLFEKYYKTIYDRERQKGSSMLLEELSEKHYKDIHKIFGFASQKLSEDENAPSSSFKNSKFDELIRSYLNDNEWSVEEINSKADDMRYDINKRLLFIIEDKDDNVKFSIRAIQEYFASIYYFNCPENIFIDRIKQVSRSAYWRNVFLFGTGYICNEQEHKLNYLYSLCGDLNGGDQEADSISIEKVTKTGSWLALDILVEGIFRNSRKYENKFAEYLKPLFELAPCEKHLSFAKLSNEIIKNWVVKFIAEFLSKREFKDQVTSWVIAASLIEYGYSDIIEVVDPYWPKESNELFLINYLYKMNISKSDWFIDKVINALNENSGEKLSSLLEDFNIFERLWMKCSFINLKGKGLLVGTLFFNCYLHRWRTGFPPGSFYSNIFNIRPLKTNLIKIELVEGYTIGSRVLDCDNTEFLENVGHLRQVFKKYDIKHLEYLMTAVLKPSQDNIDYFFKVLIVQSDETFGSVKEFCRKLSLFGTIFDSVQTKKDLKKFIDSNTENIFPYKNLAYAEMTEENIGHLLKNVTTRTIVYIKNHEKQILGFFNNFYKKYINSVNEEDIKYIQEELNGFLSLIEYPSLKNLKNKEFVDNYTLSVKNAKKIKDSNINNLYSLLVFFLPIKKIIEIVTNENEDIFDDIDIFNPDYIRMEIDLILEILRKVVTGFNISVEQNIEASIIRLLLCLIFKRKGLVKRSNLEKIDYERIYDFQYKDNDNEMCRLCLGILNPNIDLKKSSKLLTQLVQMKEKAFNEKFEKRFFVYVLRMFERLELKNEIQLEIFLKIYMWIPKELKYLKILSRYEVYLKQISEGMPTNLNDKEVMAKLDLDKYLIEDGIF